MAWRWRAPDGRTGRWHGDPRAAEADAVKASLSGRNLTVSMSDEAAAFLFGSLARVGYSIEEGQP